MLSRMTAGIVGRAHGRRRRVDCDPPRARPPQRHPRPRSPLGRRSGERGSGRFGAELAAPRRCGEHVVARRRRRRRLRPYKGLGGAEKGEGVGRRALAAAAAAVSAHDLERGEGSTDNLPEVVECRAARSSSGCSLKARAPPASTHSCGVARRAQPDDGARLAPPLARLVDRGGRGGAVDGGRRRRPTTTRPPLDRAHRGAR